MAHELSIQNGKAEAIFTGDRKSVWHRLGEYTGSEIITKEKLRSVVGVPLAKVPYSFQMPVSGNDSVERVSEQACAILRLDTGKELAGVGADYELVPHGFALCEAVEPIIDSGLATIDAAGLLRDGAAGWSLLKWDVDHMTPIVREVYRDDIQVYGLCISWVDGRHKNSYQNVTERARCRNTIKIGQAQGTLTNHVFHRKNARSRTIQAVADTFRHVIAQNERTAKEIQALRSCQLDREMWKELVQRVAIPNPTEQPDWNPKAPRAELVYERFRTKANRVFSLWSKGTGHTGDRSAWEAYNGLVESMDHDADLWRSRSEENKVLSLTDGPLAKVRDAVYDGLVAYASK